MSWGSYILKMVNGPTCEYPAWFGIHYLGRPLPEFELLDSVMPSASSPCHFLILFNETSCAIPDKIIWVESASKARDLASRSLPLLSEYRCVNLSHQETYTKLCQLLLDPSGQWEEGSSRRKEAFDCAEKLGDYCFGLAKHLTTRGLVGGRLNLEGGTLAVNASEQKVTTYRFCLPVQKADFQF